MIFVGVFLYVVLGVGLLLVCARLGDRHTRRDLEDPALIVMFVIAWPVIGILLGLYCMGLGISYLVKQVTR